MKYLFLALVCLVSMSCHAEWRPISEVLEDLSSEDSIIREFANGEFGLEEPYHPDDKRTWLYGTNEISEHVRIRDSSFIQHNLKYYQVFFVFTQGGRPLGYHHWVVFLDENHEFLSEFQYPDCREYQWIKLEESVFKTIKYFIIEKRFGPLIN